MALKIEFTPQALRDLDEIRNWISLDDAQVADRIVSRIRQSVLILADFPMLGHVGAVAGTREIKVRGLPYLVVYSLKFADRLDILSIVHGRRNLARDHTAG